MTETVARAVTQDPGVRELAATTLQRATGHLLGLQDPAGWWQGALETNGPMDAEDLLLRHFLGILTPEVTAQAAVWLRSQQRADGTWANFYGAPGGPCTPHEAHGARRLAR